MGLELSRRDREIYGEMRAFKGLLQKTISTHNILRIKGGALYVPCADGDQFADMFGHLAHCCVYHGQPPRIHPFPINGGPLTLACEELQFGFDVQTFYIEHQFLPAMKGKDIYTILLNIHGPCMVAHNAGFTLIDVLRHGLDAQAIVDKRLPNEIDGNRVLVGLLLHLDLGEGHKGTKRKKTYKIDPKTAREFLASQKA